MLSLEREKRTSIIKRVEYQKMLTTEIQKRTDQKENEIGNTKEDNKIKIQVNTFPVTKFKK
jgi:hypothetical protein